MITAGGWSIAVAGQLRAHFKVAAGGSRPGADWALSVTRDGQALRILVRAWDADIGSQAPARAGPRIERYLAGRIEGGWSPQAYGGQPGELVYAGPKAKPWWQVC